MFAREFAAEGDPVMPRTTPISLLMTKQVWTLEVDAKLSEARRTLTEQRIHHLPIVERGELVGMLSSRDLVRVLREAKAGGTEHVDAILDRSSTIREIMSTSLVTLRSDDPVEYAVERIANGSIHSLPVLDAERRLVGIVTDTDLLDYLCS
jgi:CBS domain-containing membrane protein